MCNAFSELASLAAGYEDTCTFAMDCIHGLKEKLQQNEGSCGSYHPSPNSIVGRNSGDVNDISKDRNILTPLAVRSKGRPPFKRKQSKVEQVTRKKKRKRKRRCYRMEIIPLKEKRCE